MTLVSAPGFAIELNFYRKNTAALSVFLLMSLTYAPVVLAEKARFFSSKGGSAFQLRSRETKADTGRSLLSTAKSASGVGAALYPTTSSKMDKQSSRKLLEMFDRKKNWVFHSLGNSDDEKEDVSAEDDWTSGDQQLFRDPYRQSSGVVGEFIRSDDKQLTRKNGRNRNTREKDPTQLRPEDDEGDRLTRDDTKLELELTQRVEKAGLAFSGNSPFAARTRLADSSPFARRKTGSGNPFKFKQGADGSRTERFVGGSGSRTSGGQALGQAGGGGQGGFFTSKTVQSQGIFGGTSPFAAKGGGQARKPLGLAPLNFGTGLNPGASTPVTGVGVDELTNTAKPPALGVKPPTPGNTISSIISAPPSVSSKRSMPLLFQGNRQKSPTVRSGLLNGGMRSPFDKKPGGR